MKFINYKYYNLYYIYNIPFCFINFSRIAKTLMSPCPLVSLSPFFVFSWKGWQFSGKVGNNKVCCLPDYGSCLMWQSGKMIRGSPNLCSSDREQRHEARRTRGFISSLKLVLRLCLIRFTPTCVKEYGRKKYAPEIRRIQEWWCVSYMLNPASPSYFFCVLCRIF